VGLVIEKEAELSDPHQKQQKVQFHSVID